MSVRAWALDPAAHASWRLAEDFLEFLAERGLGLVADLYGNIAAHTDAAIKAGASREEVAAALATAISLNAGAAYIYSLRSLEAYDMLKASV